MKFRIVIAISVIAAALISLKSCSSDSGSDSSDSTFVEGIRLVNNQSADVVVGEADFTSFGSDEVTPYTISSPYGNAHVDNGKLYLPDYGWERILVYNSIPTENNASADYVLGQVDFNSTDSGNGASDLYGPQSVMTYDGKLFVMEYENHRVLIYNTIPIDGPGTADVVVGQEGFGESIYDCTAYNLYQPETMTVSDDKLIVTDSENNRVLIYNTLPTDHNASADIVLGQNSFTTCVANDDDQDGSEESYPTARTLHYPAGVWSDGEKLVVSDYDNNRVLIWKTFPTSNFQPADIVLGQADFDMSIGNDDDQDGLEDAHPTARTLSYPYDGVFSNGTQLFIADTFNDRVLVWNTFPTQNFQPADVVIGQTNMTAALLNTTLANTLDNPTGVYQYGNQLIVTDEGNSRYLIYNGK